MAKFVLMFHGGESPEEPSPEVMDRWMAWFAELGDAVVMAKGCPGLSSGGSVKLYEAT